MRVVNNPDIRCKVRFIDVTPGAVILSAGGRYYIKMNCTMVNSAGHFREYNAVGVESGEPVGFNPETKVLVMEDTELHLYGCD